MAQLDQRWTEAHDKALAYTWGSYRLSAMAARESKTPLTVWRWVVLGLTIVGTAIATYIHEPTSGTLLTANAARVFGTVAGVLLASIGFLNATALSDDNQRRSLRSRAAAESLKSESYLFRSGVPPYDSMNAPQALLGRTKELVGAVADIAVTATPSEQQEGPIPTGALSADAYSTERVVKQIGWYRRKAAAYQQTLSTLRRVVWGLGFVSVVLGAAAKGALAAAIAVIGAVIAAITAHMYAERYQFLIFSYRAAANQLEIVKTEFDLNLTTNADNGVRREFIRSCENIMTAENNAWMSKWTKGSPEQAT